MHLTSRPAFFTLLLLLCCIPSIGDAAVLLKTLDGGATWLSLSANLPQSVVNSNFAYHAISALSDKGKSVSAESLLLCYAS
jgi:photosystem II stability/assembly factor-like uncharacterized protein